MRKKIFFSLIIVVIFFYISCTNNAGNNNYNASNIKKSEDSIRFPLDTFSYNNFNNISLLLAGKTPQDSTFLVDIRNKKSFKNYSEFISDKWLNHKNTTIKEINNWVEKYFDYKDTVFYPFSGPDFNYLNSFFPQARFSVLIGLEKCGNIPFDDSISISNSDTIFNSLYKSIKTNMEYSFFRTKGMRKDLNSYLEGTIPIIMMFMSLYEYEIININPVIINDKGNFDYADKKNIYAYTTNKSFDPYYEIVYRSKNDTIYRYLYYLSMDLSDNEIDETKIEKVIKNYFKTETCFLKAASYLMAGNNFNKIKRLILENFDYIITGPSGIQYKDFDEKWDLKLFGNYIGPIKLFSAYPQNDLKKAYKNNKGEPINFKFDYHPTYHSFILAVKKS